MALSKVDFNNINVTPAASKKLKWNSSANGFETGDVGGSMVLISTVTASSSSTLSFTSGIDSTYKEYIFKFIDIHPSHDSGKFSFNLSVDGGSNYNVAKTTTCFEGYHYEDDSSTVFNFAGGGALAQSTADQNILRGVGADNDQSGCATMHLFAPSSTTFVKHFLIRASRSQSIDYAADNLFAGYGNTTSAVDAIRFQFNSGNIDAGTIKMYGVT